MKYEDIKRIAIEQSAIDLNCKYDDLIGQTNKVVVSQLLTGHKRDYTEPHFCQFVCYGNALVASIDKKLMEFMIPFVEKLPGFRCYTRFKELTHEFDKYGKHIGTQNYYLPDIKNSFDVSPNFDIKILIDSEISKLYSDKRFPMALRYDCDSERRDVIAVTGYKNNEIIGIAGAVNDSDTMWQVGIDVLPNFQGQGIGKNLVKILTNEILKKGIIPFYGTAWSNIISIKTAISSGYSPAWIELSAW